MSVLIPVYNGASTLTHALQSLSDSRYRAAEYFIIDDGSTDNSAAIARQFGATVLSTGGRRGPSVARNLGARQATGDLLVFLDADVAVHPDALGRIAAHFESESHLDALIGSYDDEPADPGFVSQFKNLMHAFVHRQGSRQASTFWCGCGAVRRDVYLEHGGLDETYAKPSIEDIELGYRMLASGRKLALDPAVQCKHLKTWTFWNLIRTDVWQRGVPWTELILRTGVLPNDLNVQTSQRFSVLLTGLALLLALAGKLPTATLAVVCLLAVLWINRRFYSFLASRKGWLFAASAIPLHLLYFFYSGFSFVLGVGSHLLRKVRSAPREAIVVPPTNKENVNDS